MEATLMDIQGKLAELERIKNKRTEAVRKHYNKWFLEQDNLSEEEKIEAERKRQNRRENARRYYLANKERLKAKAKENYNKRVGKSSDESSGDEVDKIGA